MIGLSGSLKGMAEDSDKRRRVPSTSRLQRDPTIEASSEYGSSKVWNRVCKGGKAENSADGDGECKGAAKA